MPTANSNQQSTILQAGDPSAGIVFTPPHTPCTCSIPAEAPQLVADLVRACLDVDPAKRPSMEDIIAALQVSAPLSSLQPGLLGLTVLLRRP